MPSDDVDDINFSILHKFPGEQCIYLSADIVATGPLRRELIHHIRKTVYR
jgi:hypothetical protein